MDSNQVGEFREGEIDGKPFLIYKFLSQTDSHSSSSSSPAVDSGPLFICPSVRFNLWEYEKSFVPVLVPPLFPCIQSDHQQPEYMLRSDSCPLPLLPLSWCNNKEASSLEFRCSACRSSELSTSYYFCVICRVMFHKECVGSPLDFKHPSYPSFSLKLYCPPPFDHIVDSSCCQTEIKGICYYCPTKKFLLDLSCAFKPIPIVIDHPKRHPHPLTFFPKQAFLPCNVCGLIVENLPTYVCLRCVFVVHQDCIYFPYVIRICRHHHRISYTSSLPSSGKLSCGVCRRKVDNGYGAYSCNKCDDYFVHPRCALRKDLWDGEELEGIPEEPEIIVEPFKRIADGIILHFSHGHNLKLEMSKVYDQHKLCQACVLPIYEGSCYSCLDGCDFIFHEACANAPCKKYHPLHSSPLTLAVTDEDSLFKCYACKRLSSGFVYNSIEKYQKFKLCLRCASVSEPFKYQGHEHPLFLALNPEEEKSAVCQICQEVRNVDCCRKLNCIECDFVICFKCATLPYKARYQHDKHFLTFYQAKEANHHSEWCDVCERKIGDSIDKGDFFSRNRLGFYSCDECCTTLHVDCLLGEDMYMKPGQTIPYFGVQILHNNTLSRPFCQRCGQRCPQKVVFKNENYFLCSVSCVLP